MGRLTRSFLLLALAAMAALCAGCFKFDAMTTVHDDGSVDSHWRMIGVDFLRGDIEQTKAMWLKHMPDLQTKPVKDGNMAGYDFDASYPDMAAFAQGAAKLFSDPEKCKGIQRRAGWLCDAYSFDFVNIGDGSRGGPDVQITMDFRLKLPYAAEASNADSVSEDKRELYWDLAHSWITGKDKTLQTTFRIWHKGNIALTVVAALLALARALMLVKKHKAEQAAAAAETTDGENGAAVDGVAPPARPTAAGNRSRTKTLAMVYGAVFLLIAAFTVYSLTATVRFTDADTLPLTSTAPAAPAQPTPAK